LPAAGLPLYRRPVRTVIEFVVIIVLALGWFLWIVP
jgi:hypothetical protein